MDFHRWTDIWIENPMKYDPKYTKVPCLFLHLFIVFSTVCGLHAKNEVLAFHLALWICVDNFLVVVYR